MAVVVAGVVLGLAVPSFTNFQRSNAMAAAVNDLVTGTLLARSEAVKRQTPVTLCVTADPFAGSPECSADPRGAFVVFVDENGDAEVDGDDFVLLRGSAPGGRLRIWMDDAVVTYSATGFPRSSAQTRFVFCDDRGTRVEAGGRLAARVVVVDPTGRGAIRSDKDFVEAAVAELSAECSA